ncbi:MAG: hypothetical protein EOO20_00465 [Chryseobacterium sp.]|nr:MAG: hypothetical protein EOO20_00465 [Chryseobacterium sp.]
MKNIDFEKASFKDFENIEGMDPYGWAKLWGEYVNDRSKNGQFNYQQENLSGYGLEIEPNLPSNPHRNLVSINLVNEELIWVRRLCTTLNS